MRASIVQIVRPMFLKHTKKQLFKNNQIGESPQKTAETSIVKESENSAWGRAWDGKERVTSEIMASKEAKEIKEQDAAAKASIKGEAATKALKKKVIGKN